MLASINRVGFGSNTTIDAVHCDVVVFILKPDDVSLPDQIQYLQDIQTLVLTHEDVLRYARTPAEDMRWLSGPFHAFVTDRDAAMLFRLNHGVQVRVDTQMWLVPQDDKMRKILLNK